MRTQHALCLVVLLACCPLLASVEAATVRLPATADIWVSAEQWAGTDERRLCWGDKPEFKLKTIQEMAALRFDVSAIAGREVRGARLFLKPLDPATPGRLRHVRFSTVNQDWSEGRGEAAGSCYAVADLESARPWSWPGSDFSDVVMGNGHTLAGFSERRIEADGWLSVEIAPAMLYAMCLGDSDGLALQEGGNHWFHNHLFASVQAAHDAPFLEVELGGDLGTAAPATPIVAVEPSPAHATLRHGAARVVIGPSDGVFCWKATLDGRPLERWRIAHPSPHGETVFHLTDLEPGSQGTLELTAVAPSGARSAPAVARLVASPALAPPPTLDPPTRPQGPGGVLAAASGRLRCWAVPGLVKIDPVTGSPQNDDLAQAEPGAANGIWDGRQVRLFGARAEIVSFQLVVERTGADAVEGVSVSPGSLAGPDGASLPISGFETFSTWYARNKAGRWQPAYLLPLRSDASFTIPNPERRLAEQRNQTVYLDLFIPPDARPGTYRGAVTIAAGGETGVQIPLVVDVLDFALPERLSFIPQMNAYTLPEDGMAYYKLAHQNRCVFFYRCPTPRLSGSGAATTVDWTAYDRLVGPLLTGELFQGNRRSGMPLEVMPLPFEDSWPTAMTRENYAYAGCWPTKGDTVATLNEHYMTAPPIEQALSREYQEAFLAVQRQFIEHFREKGWDRTEMQCMFMGKITHRTDYGKNMWWTTDEPYFWADWQALRFFNRLWTQGRGGASPAQWAARADISRPQWQADLLDGIVTSIYVSGGPISDPAMHRRVVEQARRGGWQVRVYGGANPDTRSNSETVAWLLDARLRGADAVLPWQTLGSERALDDNDASAFGCNALFVPGRRLGHPVLADLRVKAFRDGQQLVEYLELLAARQGLRSEQLAAMVQACIGLRASVQAGASADNADAVRMGVLPDWKISGLRRAVAELLGR